MQTLGSPFKGTPLAGSVADLGQALGIGCGSNPEMADGSWFSYTSPTYNSKVWAKATEFIDYFFTYDYCNFASNLLLNDPDDGLVEEASALPGGGVNSLGSAEGWCHTEGIFGRFI